MSDEIGKKARDSLLRMTVYHTTDRGDVEAALNDRDKLREQVAELEECFAPIATWYSDDGLTALALTDAVDDFISHRKAVLDLRQQVAELNRGQPLTAPHYETEESCDG